MTGARSDAIQSISSTFSPVSEWCLVSITDDHRRGPSLGSYRLRQQIFMGQWIADPGWGDSSCSGKWT